MLYQIDPIVLPEVFTAAWGAAAKHLQRVAQHRLSWTRANLYQPIDHHLSFRVGNQLFFVFVEVDGGIPFEGGPRHLLLQLAEKAHGHACLMPMRTQAGGYVPRVPGWGLIDASSGTTVDPPVLVSSELIVMTDWELMDLAVQIVRDQLEEEGQEIANWQSSLEVDPSIWHVGKKDGIERWIVVRGVRWPVRRPERPGNLTALVEMLSGRNREGYFAWVGVANADDPGNASNPTPLYRGHEVLIQDYGIEPVQA